MKRRSGTIYLLCLAAPNTIAAAVGCSSSSHNGTASTGAAGTSGADAGHLQATTLYLVGDSTVCGFNDPYYYPRYGYGTQIGKYLDSSVTVNNLALSGRSSKSFIDPTDNPNYAVLTSSIKAGDYLIIGFGHNDEKAPRANVRSHFPTST